MFVSATAINVGEMRVVCISRQTWRDLLTFRRPKVTTVSYSPADLERKRQDRQELEDSRIFECKGVAAQVPEKWPSRAPLGFTRDSQGVLTVR